MISSLVEFMLGQPGLSVRLLAVHVADESGQCRGCRQYDRPTPAHPCTLRLHAEAAQCVSRRHRHAPPQCGVVERDLRMVLGS